MAITQVENDVTSACTARRSAQIGSQRQGLNISIRTGVGTGRTLLSAFDNALQGAGTADFNLVTLSSVIPPASRIRHVEGPLAGDHGDLLFCVRAEAFADQPGDVAWAGLGWVTDETGGGLFVEHHGHSEASVVEQIEQSLEDMNRSRGGGYGEIQMTLASAECTDQPVCALVLAAYRVSSWHDDADPPPEEDLREDSLVSAPPAASPTPASGPGGTHSQVIDEWVSPNGAHPPHLDELDSAPSPVARVTVEKEVDFATARRYYQLYVCTFGELESEAVARQLLHEDEFLAEMLDPRVLKCIAWDEDDVAIGMTTLTSDLETVPWISPGYFKHHYPEHYARGAVYYLGFTLVHPDHRGSHTFHAMLTAMAQMVIEDRAVVGWDMCLANEHRGLGASAVEYLNRLADVTVEPVDRQTYYAVAFHGP